MLKRILLSVIAILIVAVVGLWIYAGVRSRKLVLRSQWVQTNHW